MCHSNECDNFAFNIINSTNSIFASDLGWKEISENRTEAVTKYLTALDYTGFLGAKERSACPGNETFNFSKIQLISKVVDRNGSNEPECFYFGSGSICIPLAQVEVTWS